MATAVVSGRVDEDVKRKVDRVIERAGTTVGDVIRNVWMTISITGELPSTQVQEDEFRQRRTRFKEFMELRSTLPHAPEWAAGLTDEQLRNMMYDDMLEKEKRFVGGESLVPLAD